MNVQTSIPASPAALRPDARQQAPLNQAPPNPAALNRSALNRSALTVHNLPMHDPRVRPLLDELAVEYDSRYGDLFGRGAAAEELNRYPASEFTGPGGALLMVQENGESIAGRGFPPVQQRDGGVQTDLDALGAPPPRARPFRPGGAGGAGGPPGLPSSLPDHRSAPARSQAPVPHFGL